ncbi:hypothetical protein Tco_0342791, partial [Tanacetum coccineum]
GLNLHSYVQMAFPDHVMEIVEPTLLSVYEEAANRNYRHRVDGANRRERLEDGMISLARTGLTCSKESPKDRMEISSIVHELHNSINDVFGFN